MRLPSVTRLNPLIFAALCASGIGTAADAQAPYGVVDASSPVSRLGRYIRLLAGAPRDVEALLGAGQASLDLGDANAALGFFARAEEASPSNGRAKAGLGSALVMSERPDEALKLFADAVSLGVPEAEVARDRGLAYDLRGDSRRAQRDYVLALARGRDDELVRRYALSQAISGDRQAALATIDPLLRKQDQGAWRARAFILAMTGDVSGANTVAHQLMVPAVADAMAPLLARLATLNPTQRAHAVNFGTVPADGTQMAMVTPGDPYLRNVQLPAPGRVAPQGRPIAQAAPVADASAGVGLVPKGVPLGSGSEARRAASAASSSIVPAVPKVETGSQRVAAIDRSRLPPEARGDATGVTILPRTTLPAPDTARALVQPSPPVQTGATSRPAMGTTVPTTVQPTIQSTTVATIADDTVSPIDTPIQTRAGLIGPPRPDSLPSGAAPITTAPVTTAPVTTAPVTTAPITTAPVTTAPARPAVVAPASTPAPQPALAPVQRPSTPPGSRLAGLLDDVQREPEAVAELPNVRELRAARAAAKRKLAELAAQAAREKAARDQAAKDKAAKAEAAAAAKRNPARLWVQVATGRADSSLTWKRIKADNAAALKGLGAWSAPYKSTYRLLAGPVKSAAAARDLVMALAKNGVGALPYSSEAGEEVTKIDAK